MATWTNSPTQAHNSVGDALKVVDNLLSFAKDHAGKPSFKERALFGAAVVFTYGVWENFVEQLAIELVRRVALEVDAERVPEQIRKLMEKKTAWELTVTPGWRKLWIDHVTVNAVGDDDLEKYGMNTAKAGQVKQLLALAGVDEPYASVPEAVVPAHLPHSKHPVVDAINQLVELRGEIVHTGKVPASLRKGHVRAWRTFVETATDKVDAAARTQCKALLS